MSITSLSEDFLQAEYQKLVQASKQANLGTLQPSMFTIDSLLRLLVHLVVLLVQEPEEELELGEEM